MDESAQLNGNPPNLDWSCIQGLTGALGGVGNIDLDPQFVDAANDDLRLQAGSPCIDAADNTAVPPDQFDLDGDLDMNEPLPIDLDGSPRFSDDPATPDTGNGIPPIVDMGAFEFQSDQFPLFAFGLRHTAAGQANLSIDPNGNLVVSNIGSSGEDGVSIDLGEADGWGGSFLHDVPHQVGARMDWSLFGTVDGTPQQLVAKGHTESVVGDEIHAFVDFSAGTTDYLVEVIKGGQVVLSAPVPQGNAVYKLLPPIELLRIEPVTWLKPDPNGPDWTCHIFWAPVDFEGTCLVEVDGTVIQDAEEITITPLGLTATIGAFSRVALTGTNQPEFTLVDENLSLFGFAHRSLGEAHMLGGQTGQALTISNIGSSGEDGVSIDLGESEYGTAFHVSLDPVGLSTPGTAFDVAATGTFSGIPDTFLGIAGFANTGGAVQASANLSAIGSSNIRIEVFNGGNFVGSAVVPGGGVVGELIDAGFGAPQITGCGKLPPDPPCYIFEFDRPGNFTPLGGTAADASNGGGSFEGDEIRLLADNATGAIDSLSGFDITGTNLGSLTITDEDAIIGSLDPPIRAPAPHNILKNRYISIDPRGVNGTNPPNLHIRVQVDSSAVNGVGSAGPWWATAPVNGQPPSPATCISVLSPNKPTTEPDWSGCPTVHLTGCPIVPTTTYAIAVEADGVLSGDALFDTQAKPGAKWMGDVVGTFSGAPDNKWSAPNLTVNADDFVAAIKTFQNPNALNATHLSVTDMEPLQNGTQINLKVNINDVFAIIQGFQGFEYNEGQGGPDLTQCP
ncbi:MAG: hypothetical protein IH987_14960 [Planctomycetes bacterium]|nr:hypothetical protein [Planctomycetota bacterium]